MPKAKTTRSTNAPKLDAEALLSHINDKFGKNTMVRASDSSAIKPSRISTGITSLDIVLNGGLVEGRVHQYRGPFSSTKTTTMHLTAKEYLTKYPEGCYVLIDAENTSDTEFLKYILGFTDDMLERTFTVRPDSGENAGDIAIEVAKCAKKVMVGVDSVDALTPTSEQDANMDKAGVSPGARMMNKFIRKLIPVMKTDLLSPSPRTTVILISQLREKIGVLFGSPDATWGGKGKEFAASTILKFSRTAWIREGAKTTGSTLGMEIQIEVIKCKGPGHGEFAEAHYYKAYHEHMKPGEFDNTRCLVDWCIRSKAVVMSGRKITYKKKTFSSRGEFEDYLRRRSIARSQLKEQIVEKRLAKYYRGA